MKSISELKSEAYSLLSENWGNVIAATLVLAVVNIAASLIPSIIGELLRLTITGPIAFGTALYFLKFSKGEKAEIEDLFFAFKSKENFLLSLKAMLITVAIIIPILFLFGTIWIALFIGDIGNLASILGDGTAEGPYTMDPAFITELSSAIFQSGIGTIIFSGIVIVLVPITIVSLALSQVYFIIVDQKTKSAREAIKMSWNVMKGNKRKLFLLQLSFIGWFILTVFTLFIGLIFLYPYIMTTYSKFYQNLKVY